jgi:hypothetical protein
MNSFYLTCQLSLPNAQRTTKDYTKTRNHNDTANMISPNLQGYSPPTYTNGYYTPYNNIRHSANPYHNRTTIVPTDGEYNLWLFFGHIVEKAGKFPLFYYSAFYSQYTVPGIGILYASPLV